MAEFRAILDDPDKLAEVTKAVFDSVDTDGSGEVDRSELQNAMTMVATQAEIPPPDGEAVTAAMNALDVNQDGKISVDEFKELVK